MVEKTASKDFYNKGDTAETVIRRIEQSDEDIIMLSLYFEYGVESTYELYKKAIELLGVHVHHSIWQYDN